MLSLDDVSNIKQVRPFSLGMGRRGGVTGVHLSPCMHWQRNAGDRRCHLLLATSKTLTNNRVTKSCGKTRDSLSRINRSAQLLLQLYRALGLPAATDFTPFLPITTHQYLEALRHKVWTYINLPPAENLVHSSLRRIPQKQAHPLPTAERPPAAPPSSSSSCSGSVRRLVCTREPE